MVARLTKGVAFLNLLIGLAAGIFASQTVLAQNFITVDYPGAQSTIVNAINNKGAMVGFYRDSQNVDHSFVLRNGVFTNIDFPNAADTYAYGMNDGGDVVGLYDDGSAGHGFLLSNGVYTTFDHPDSPATVPTGINNVGKIVGYYYQTSSGKYVGFLLSGGAYSDINVSGSLDTEVWGINSVGAIVGFYVDADEKFNGFLFQNGIFNTIDYPNAASTEARGINDSGQIVGVYQSLGFEYNPANPSSPFTTINFPAAVIGLTVLDINDGGQLVGGYYDAANILHGFVSAVGPFAYVANVDSGGVSMIDIPSSLPVTNIGVGSAPYGVAISPKGNQVYVTNSGGNSVSVIDTASSTVVATIPVQPFPFGVAFTPDGTAAYVAQSNSSSVAVIDTASRTVVNTVPVQSGPTGVAMALTSNGPFAYVTNSAAGTVSVIKVGSNPTVVQNIPVGNSPVWVAVTPNSSLAYVVNSGGNNVSVISVATNTVTATIPVGTYPWGVAFTPDSSFAYVANNNANTVSVIDTKTNKIVTTVSGFNYPYFVALSTDGSFAYVTNANAGVSVIDTASNTITATVPAGVYPFGVAIASAPQTELQITQPLSPTQPNSFNFGTNTYVAQYPPGTNFSGVTMTLTEVPITQAQFRQFVASIPAFANASCIVYAGAGGNCIDHQVTCTPSPCPPAASAIDVQTSFTTPQSILNPGYLTTPIGQNQWKDIFSGIYGVGQLITVKGKSSGFSEFVAVDLGASNPQGQAKFQIVSPIFPVTYSQGQVIPISFQLTSVVPPKPPVTDAQASISVVMIADANGNPTQQVVFSKAKAFTQGNPGVYNYSLDATPYAAGTYSVTIYGTAFPSFQGQFTIKAAAGSVVLVAKPTSLTFPNTHVGTPSAAMRDSLFNEGSLQGIVSSVQTTGDFQLQTNHCANGVKPATHCDVYIVFSPTDLGMRTGTLSYYDNASGSPQNVSLSGAGTTTTTTSLTSSLNPSFYGQAVTLTAVVVPAVSGTPTGNVTFYDGATSLGSVALTNGTAALASSALTGGTHSLTAAYAGGGYFDPSTSSVLVQKVARSGVTVALTSSQNPSHVGQQVTFSAVVSGILATPTGSVTFIAGSKVLGTVPLVNGQASWTETFTRTGTRSIFAHYLGDQNYLPRTSKAVKQVVEP